MSDCQCEPRGNSPKECICGKRIVYEVDVGNMPREKAEAFIREKMDEHATKIASEIPEWNEPPKLREPAPEVKRKLASIRAIDDILPIEGADEIEVAVIGGWRMITQKSNNFEPNDLVCMFEIDSFLPVREEFEFLRKGCFKSTKNLGDGFRIKSMKMRGVVSQGLILPLDELFKDWEVNPYDPHYRDDENSPIVPQNGFYYKKDNTTPCVEIVDGEDLTDILGVQKYEKPIPAHLQGRTRGNFPSWIRKTDQERAQNISRFLGRRLDEVFEVSLKLDGSSMTVYVKDGVVGVCSRNLDLLEDDDSTFWKVAKELSLPEKLLAIHNETEFNFAIQGELMGPGVQGNREKFDHHRFFLFDIWDIDNQRYFSPEQRMNWMQGMLDGIEHVPVVDVQRLGYMVSEDNIIADLLNIADNQTSINHAIAEGIVFKNMEGGDFSFKIISNKFLLKEKD